MITSLMRILKFLWFNFIRSNQCYGSMRPKEDWKDRARFVVQNKSKVLDRRCINRNYRKLLHQTSPQISWTVYNPLPHHHSKNKILEIKRTPREFLLKSKNVCVHCNFYIRNARNKKMHFIIHEGKKKIM